MFSRLVYILKNIKNENSNEILQDVKKTTKLRELKKKIFLNQNLDELEPKKVARFFNNAHFISERILEKLQICQKIPHQSKLLIFFVKSYFGSKYI